LRFASRRASVMISPRRESSSRLVARPPRRPRRACAAENPSGVMCFHVHAAIDAEMLGTTRACLRSRDEAKPLTPQRSERGHRRYSRYQLRLAARIRELVDQGTALDAACRIIILEDQLRDALELNAELSPDRRLIIRALEPGGRRFDTRRARAGQQTIRFGRR
jgi:DNA-binding transcriptional MerR regulator